MAELEALATEDKYAEYRRHHVSALTRELAEADLIEDEKERDAARLKVYEDNDAGRLTLGFPVALTARYRLMWDEDGKLVADPEQEYEPGSTTAGGPRYCFESDDLRAVRAKVKELRLRYVPDDSTEEREA